MAIPRRLQGSAQQGLRVNAVMVEKALVFIGQKRGGEIGIYRSRVYRQPPTAICDCISAQQSAVAIQHLDRGFHLQWRQDRRRNPLIQFVI
ncbi:MAG: hypothetical protein ACD_54C00634G0002 [uncultured bacterium]|nr:MAG: hypothetical protein ACD_54C00634G0002 [uncultured bacterium]